MKLRNFSGPDGPGPADVVVIGAGIAGLTAAAVLARDGARVELIEQHNVPGGCASFYQRDGYRFDVGATLVSGFGPRGVHRRLFERFEIAVEAHAVEPSMVVHLPDVDVVRFGDTRWSQERLRVFGVQAERFWQRQERIAALAWDFSSRFPMLPVDAAGIAATAGAFRPRHLPLIATLGRTLASIMPAHPDRRLAAFVDAQLLITAQTDVRHADLAYGSTALDLAREGTFHLADGPSTIAVALARVIRRAGGRIAYRSTVATIDLDPRGRTAGVTLADGQRIAASCVVAAIPVANALALLPQRYAKRGGSGQSPERHGGSGQSPERHGGSGQSPERHGFGKAEPCWGAFMAYVALPPGAVGDDVALHHQIVREYDAPPGEGNTAFLSFSGPGEGGRARDGGRALTISTHTDVTGWERAYRDGSYAARTAEYGERLRAALERVLPGAWARARFVDYATPHTFERYTLRARGLVGGSPQTAASATLGARSHRSGVPGLFFAGDTVFPGQSTVGASLSGVAAARAAGARF